MAFDPLQIVGLVLGFFGMVGTLATALLPQWKVSAFVGSNLIVFERTWEGLWMNCIRQVTVRLQCKFYNSLLALPPGLEAARALMCVAVALSLIALLIGISGTKKIQCKGSNERVKTYLLGTSGVLFILTGIFVLIPVCWTANIIIRDFYNPAVHVAQKRELGAALFLGWASTAVLFIGGGLLCGFCCCNRKKLKHGHPAAVHPAPQTDKLQQNGTVLSKTSTSYV
ncbi:claudin-17 [Physeter macrocephalus]|uniref:Claudin n=1 Tax=Physeter macrocephalus TaxID=9755 RepID=A0A2Y9FPG5_PHYMC|nr:claudin-17 [Physeter catodon]|eukprot:XP_007126530.1 claudin-17 [Physeter catodon]